MNNKRQTVWLVSMLSLMVILSAYYLFTEDVSTPSNDIVTTDGAGQQGAKSDATEASGSAAGNDAIVTNEVTDGGADAGNAADQAAADSASADDQAAGGASAANGGTAENAASGGKDAAKSDEDVLKEMAEAGGVATSVFSQLQERRDDSYYDEFNKLMGQVSDTKLSDKDAAASMEQLDLLEDKNAKITALEEELSKQFGNAAVVPDANDRYKIVVQSDKLERSQADSILTTAIEELGLTPDQLTIQYVK
ncbi:SpoIIIAH-like family protein [Paenibacillus sp. GCM10023250]|uniref:SpoIIIAH-like family protein n=1 Tax=Paenibacillus sp. GCM10023250 TaxID=3252648 RepID=UPI00360F9A6A